MNPKFLWVAGKEPLAVREEESPCNGWESPAGRQESPAFLGQSPVIGVTPGPHQGVQPAHESHCACSRSKREIQGPEKLKDFNKAMVVRVAPQRCFGVIGVC